MAWAIADVNRICLQALVLVVLGGALAAEAQDLQRGLSAYERGNYSDALRDLEPHASRGDPDALFTLGRMYANGEFVRRDFERARAYFLRSYQAGKREAAAKIAQMYEFGDGVPVDLREARRWRDLSYGYRRYEDPPSGRGDPRGREVGSPYDSGAASRTEGENWAWSGTTSSGSAADEWKAHETQLADPRLGVTSDHDRANDSSYASAGLPPVNSEWAGDTYPAVPRIGVTSEHAQADASSFASARPPQATPRRDTKVVPTRPSLLGSIALAGILLVMITVFAMGTLSHAIVFISLLDVLGSLLALLLLFAGLWCAMSQDSAIGGRLFLIAASVPWLVVIANSVHQNSHLSPAIGMMVGLTKPIWSTLGVLLLMGAKACFSEQRLSNGEKWMKNPLLGYLCLLLGGGLAYALVNGNRVHARLAARLADEPGESGLETSAGDSMVDDDWADQEDPQYEDEEECSDSNQDLSGEGESGWEDDDQEPDGSFDDHDTSDASTAPDDFDPYAILAVSPGVTKEQLRTSYVSMIKQYHPDRVHGLAPEIQQLAQEQVKKINRAYEELLSVAV